MLVDISTQGTKEINEIGLAFKELCVQYKQAASDGWKTTQDVPAILMGSFQKLMIAFEGADKVIEEGKTEPFKASIGAIVPILEGVDEIIKKSE